MSLTEKTTVSTFSSGRIAFLTDGEPVTIEIKRDDKQPPERMRVELTYSRLSSPPFTARLTGGCVVVEPRRHSSGHIAKNTGDAKGGAGSIVNTGINVGPAPRGASPRDERWRSFTQGESLLLVDTSGAPRITVTVGPDGCDYICD